MKETQLQPRLLMSANDIMTPATQSCTIVAPENINFEDAMQIHTGGGACSILGGMIWFNL